MAQQDALTIAVVDFAASWGDKADNLARIAHAAAQAVAQGAQMVLFPEMALTGYNTPDDSVVMQQANAVTIDGPEARTLAALAQDHGIYLIVGLPERDAATDTIYNAALVTGPDGMIGCYRKLHPAGKELLWSAKGDAPFLFDTPWGPVGLAICYDVYQFPEVTRAYCALGARLVLNPTAMPLVDQWEGYYHNQLRARVIENGCFLASANLVGEDNGMAFPGASLILGPCEKSAIAIRYYADPVVGEEGQRIATIDLSMADKARTRLPVFTNNGLTGEPDWRPEIYSALLRQVRAHETWSRLSSSPARN